MQWYLLLLVDIKLQDFRPKICFRNHLSYTGARNWTVGQKGGRFCSLYVSLHVFLLYKTSQYTSITR